MPKKRIYLGRVEESFNIPSLLSIQTDSYFKFLQIDALKAGREVEDQGLESVFRSVFPIRNSSDMLVLHYDRYFLDFEKVIPEAECRKKGLTYGLPLRARFFLEFKETGEIRQKDVYIADIPMMTEGGSFIINGSEKVVVSQIHRSPGVVFDVDEGKDKTNVYVARIIPYRGSWFEFEIDQKKKLLFVKIDKKKKVLATVFLRALGLDSREQIIQEFYKIQEVSLKDVDFEKKTGLYLAENLTLEDENSRTYLAGERLLHHDVQLLMKSGIKKLRIIDFNLDENEEKNYISSNVILNCFDTEARYIRGDTLEMTFEDAIAVVYPLFFYTDFPAEIPNKQFLYNTLFDEKKYDLGRVGRYKLNKKFNLKVPDNFLSLTHEDIIVTMRHLIRAYEGIEKTDDIDHLGNRRVRSVGELLEGILKVAFLRMEKFIKEKMSLKELNKIRFQDILSFKLIVLALKEFFATGQLVQFMDQVNPLAQLTHKRRLNALGPGGLVRERAGFEVRDVHYTHYGRMCPIETPEGQNIGLIVSLSIYARINEYGFLESPYRRVENGKIMDTVDYLSALEEERHYVAQFLLEEEEKDDIVSVRRSGNYLTRALKDVDYMDVSPRQAISISAALIPFLEHDDANRALMGSNMQRQAVPLLFSEAPIVGTGMEKLVAQDSGMGVRALEDGTVEYVSAEKILVRSETQTHEHVLVKYQRTNQDTCYNQLPIVDVGQKVSKGEIIADGPSMQNGELALGRNLLMAFLPWNGYNFEDAILISERVLKEDIFTSIHIKEFVLEVRGTKLGAEKITRDIPNASKEALRNLDERGVVRIGAYVKAGDILVGKVVPKAEVETTPEFKLLNAIFGEKAKSVKDASLRVPHGIDGVIVNVEYLKKDEESFLSFGANESIKIFIAQKRKLKVGDKMAGRHGNKGIVAKILPEEDMPYLADGTPLDICLNPLGVPSRMNLGQVIEATLGLAGFYRGENYSVPVFESPTLEQVKQKLFGANLPENGKFTVFDGYTGLPFENPVSVGVMYILKLYHLVDDKMHARSIGPYSLVTQQPLGGKSQFGGQRFGEMEVWALEAYGAANTLQEILTIKSDDVQGRIKIYENIIKGEVGRVMGVPESFNVLIQELRGLALDVSISDADGNQIPLTERDTEIIEQKAQN